MIREEPRTGRIADSEFTFWECWESNDDVPAFPERHWFRSDTGLEAATYDHMLQMLYRQHLGLPNIQQTLDKHIHSATSEWDKRTACTVRVRGEDIELQICEHSTEANGGAPVSVKVVGPNGLVTSSYQEMLERLGIAEPPAVAGGASAVGSPPAVAGGASAVGAPVLSVTDSDPGVQEPPAEGPSQLQAKTESVPSDRSSKPKPTCSGMNPDLSKFKLTDEDMGDLTRDYKDGREHSARLEKFEREHPFLWNDYEEALEDGKCEPNGVMTEMKIVWYAEQTKLLRPELYAAALDPKKYKEYMDKNDFWSDDLPEWSEDLLERPEGGDSVASDTPRCQFIKSDGETCGSYAVKNKRFCYFHGQTAEGRKKNRKKASYIPVLEDDLAVQMAVTNICRGLAEESLEPKRAATLLYGLQVATVALRQKRKTVN